MSIRKFGNMRDGREVHAFTLTTDTATVTILNYGAVIQSFITYGVDIVGGFDNIESYFDDPSHQGGVIGRVANRIKNARFEMDGKVYELTKNNGNNSLHGGCGFDRKLWDVVSYTDNEVELSYVSEDGEEGFPARLTATVKYTLIDSTLIISYKAIPEGKTPIVLTNHSYFNLDGFGKDILGHNAQIFADRYTATNDELIPTGERPLVVGTPYDFNTPKAIGRDVAAIAGGYDSNIFIKPERWESFLGKELGLGAIVDNGRLKMSVYTDQPCIQFYIAGGLGNWYDFKGGIKPISFGGICLETQIEPDAPNRGEGFYNAGEIYTHTAVYKVEKI